MYKSINKNVMNLKKYRKWPMTELGRRKGESGKYCNYITNIKIK